MKEESLLEEREETIALLDVYEKLLSPQQLRTLNAYFRYDLSLGEIAEEEGISRAAVHDALTKGIAKLKKSEEDVGMLSYKRKLVTLAENALQCEGQERTNRLENLGKEIIHGI